MEIKPHNIGNVKDYEYNEAYEKAQKIAENSQDLKQILSFIRYIDAHRHYTEIEYSFSIELRLDMYGKDDWELFLFVFKHHKWYDTKTIRYSLSDFSDVADLSLYQSFMISIDNGNMSEFVENYNQHMKLTSRKTILKKVKND